MSGIQQAVPGLDPLSMFALEEEQVVREAPKSKSFSGKVSDVFSEASAFSSGNAISSGTPAATSEYSTESPVKVSERSTLTSREGLPPRASTKKNIFRDEDPRILPTTLPQHISPARASVVGDDAQPPYQTNLSTPPVTPTTIRDPSEDALFAELLTGEIKLMGLKDAFVQLSAGRYMPGTLYMTNYRTLFMPAPAHKATIAAQNPALVAWLNIPLACIEKIEKEKSYGRDGMAGLSIVIRCKDMRVQRVTIQGASGSDVEVDRAISVLSAYAFPNQVKFLFAFTHVLSRSDGTVIERRQPYDAVREFTRMGVLDYNTDGLPASTALAERRPGAFLWRMSSANVGFRLCETYAQLLAMPSLITDEELFLVAAFRSGRRLPTMSWGSARNGTTLWRSSQPKCGVTSTCMQDEKLLDIIAKSCTHRGRQPLLHIVDCRPRASAMANKAAGAGYESQSSYPYIRLEFYNIGNIHVMRDSIKSIASTMLGPSPASGDVYFGKIMEDSGWLTHIRLMLKAAVDTALFMARGDPVLVHCSHGWDRTAQVCSLTMVLLDPHYRTIDGFATLVEKEWNSFGHAFGMRCGHAQDKNTRVEDEISPIFIQFLDCMWQLVRQYPQHFEYNARYLLTVADHVYSGRFGTFLFSSDKQRDELSAIRCADLWTYLECNREIFTNPLYIKNPDFRAILPPLSQVLRNVVPWSDYFYRWAAVPSIMVPAAEYSEQLIRNGACLSPALADETTETTHKDLAVPPVISHDSHWEGAFRKVKKVKDFFNRQVDGLTELLRRMNCPEEQIAACLAGNFQTPDIAEVDLGGSNGDTQVFSQEQETDVGKRQEQEDEEEQSLQKDAIEETRTCKSSALLESGLLD
jgi:myotubularin-related protein 1/2